MGVSSRAIFRTATAMVIAVVCTCWARSEAAEPATVPYEFRISPEDLKLDNIQWTVSFEKNKANKFDLKAGTGQEFFIFQKAPAPAPSAATLTIFGKLAVVSVDEKDFDKTVQVEYPIRTKLSLTGWQENEDDGTHFVQIPATDLSKKLQAALEHKLNANQGKWELTLEGQISFINNPNLLKMSNSLKIKLTKGPDKAVVPHARTGSLKKVLRKPLVIAVAEDNTLVRRHYKCFDRPAHFMLSQFGRQGERYQSEGLVIYEGMRCSLARADRPSDDREALSDRRNRLRYTVSYQARTPVLTELRLQLQVWVGKPGVKGESGETINQLTCSPYTITLPVQTIPPTPPDEDGYGDRYVISGTLPIPEEDLQDGWKIVQMTRNGTARFGSRPESDVN